jgi:regulator of replication initiation timing
MKQQLNEVKQQNEQLKTENQTLKQQVVATQAKAEQANETAEALAVATEEAVKASAAQESKTSIGGYGELHYNNLQNQGSGADKD